MSLINVTNVQIKNNPAPLNAPLAFTITFECLKDIPGEIDWKLIYVGSSEDESYDQVLESFSMGPLGYGVMEFDLEAEAPDTSKIPSSELLGVTALILTTSFNGKEFFRIGYYVYNNYTDPELLENTPEQVIVDKVFRNILAEKPRITRFEIRWEEQNGEAQNEAIGENNHSNHFENNMSFHENSRMMANPMMNKLFDEKYGEGSNNPFLMQENKTNDSTPFRFLEDPATQGITGM